MDKTTSKDVLLERLEENYNLIRKLERLGLPEDKSWEYANSRKGYWRIAGSFVLHKTVTNQFLEKVGFRPLTQVYIKT